MNVTVPMLLRKRVAGGFREDESRALLRELLGAHSGDNLAHALVVEGFASERLAYAFVESRGGAS